MEDILGRNADCARERERQNEAMNGEPKRLRIVSFALHATRGLIRNQTMRRWVMFFTVLAAMLMLFAGMTFLQPFLSPKEHPAWFILFWIACGWLTITALLLALFDFLMVRLQARSAQRELREDLDEE
jgi:cellulose synthase/poly-beta-1,6-N-acetylglucosamine synthase-like glycosyltransferase